MEKGNLLSKCGTIITIREIELIISNLLIQVIENNTPHKWVAAEEPFYNVYKDKISYDYSGEVKKMIKEDLEDLIKTINNEPLYCYVSTLQRLISNIYVGQWVPSYESNRGKNWISYEDILEYKYMDWKSDNFVLYDEEEDIDFEELDMELDEILYNFFEEMPEDIYIAKLYQAFKKL